MALNLHAQEPPDLNLHCFRRAFILLLHNLFHSSVMLLFLFLFFIPEAQSLKKNLKSTVGHRSISHTTVR